MMMMNRREGISCLRERERGERGIRGCFCSCNWWKTLGFFLLQSGPLIEVASDLELEMDGQIFGRAEMENPSFVLFEKRFFLYTCSVQWREKNKFIFPHLFGNLTSLVKWSQVKGRTCTFCKQQLDLLEIYDTKWHLMRVFGSFCFNNYGNSYL